MAENTTAVTDVNAADPDSGDTLTYSLQAGGDSAFFTIDSASGMLSFVAPPDYETAADANADNVYDLTVVVTDGALPDSQDLTVTVTDVYENHAPVISSGGGGPTAAVSVVENTTAVTDIDATDIDLR